MASTNKTSNFNLSQYIGSDKPTYLNDYNNDMLKIDTAMYQNKEKSESNESKIGDLTNLNTTDKSSLVGAINEVNTGLGNIPDYASEIGDLENLNTTDKSSLVGAINEVNTNTSNNTTNIGDLTNLTTTDKSSLVGAINEIVGGEHVVLYHDTTGTKTTIALSDSLANYRYIEIYGKDLFNDGIFTKFKLDETVDYIDFSSFDTYSTPGSPSQMRFVAVRIKIDNNTQLSKYVENTMVILPTKVINEFTETDEVYITDVIGIK